MALAYVRGQFTKIKRIINFCPVDKSRASDDVEMDVASVNTGIKKRDEHLLIADFFDQDKYPIIEF
jgi:polyisoprenoid-binding protein YceI